MTNCNSNDQNRPENRGRTAQRTAQSGSEKEQLIAFLTGETPRTIEDISKQFSWKPHSAHAMLSGLRKAGSVVERLPIAEGSKSFGYRIVVAKKRRQRGEKPQ